MAKLRADAFVRSVRSLLAERQAVALKEKDLVSSLNAVLNKIGYQVVGLDARARAGKAGRPAKRARRSRGRRPGRPPTVRARRRARGRKKR
ncbi:MAG: hypothetical protein ACE5JN_05940 [Candidatus Methylomirabilia bacterium]